MVSRGVLSIDLSGPHVPSHKGNKYAFVAVLHMDEGYSVPFVRFSPTKSGHDCTQNLLSILAQLTSMCGGAPPVYRLHSDCGNQDDNFLSCRYEQNLRKYLFKYDA